jgi:hypothetical protein
MADEDTALLDEAAQVRDWRLQQLRRLGYGLRQRAALLERIEANELQLEDVRHLADLGCPVETAWWVLS